MDNDGKENADSNSPTASQGIFSSPDLTVNTENLDQLQPAPSEDNRSRIASAFAQADASAAHDQLSAQMASQATDGGEAVSGTVLPAQNVPGQNSTVSIATGDIRLPGTKKKSKLPIIIAAVVALVAVGGVVAYLILNSRKDNGSNRGLGSLASDLVNFADYSISEDGEQALANGYVGTRSYRLEQQVKLAQAMSENVEYFDGLNATFNTVYPRESAPFYSLHKCSFFGGRLPLAFCPRRWYYNKGIAISLRGGCAPGALVKRRGLSLFTRKTRADYTRAPSPAAVSAARSA